MFQLLREPGIAQNEPQHPLVAPDAHRLRIVLMHIKDDRDAEPAAGPDGRKCQGQIVNMDHADLMLADRPPDAPQPERIEKERDIEDRSPARTPMAQTQHSGAVNLLLPRPAGFVVAEQENLVSLLCQGGDLLGQADIRRIIRLQDHEDMFFVRRHALQRLPDAASRTLPPSGMWI